MTILDLWFEVEASKIISDFVRIQTMGWRPWPEGDLKSFEVVVDQVVSSRFLMSKHK
jgi:hypothetical protein